VLSSNSRAVLTHGKTISSATHALSHKLEDFIKSSSRSTLKLCSEAKQFETKELDALAAHSERIDQQLQRVQEALGVIQAKDGADSEALGVVQSVLKETHETFKSGFGAWGESSRKSCEGMCKEAELAGVGGFTAVEKALKAMGSLVESIVREAREYVHAERESVVEAKTLADSTANCEIEWLRQQNEALTRMLDNEKVKAEKGKDELIRRVSGLVNDFTRERERGLTEAVEVVQGGNGKAVEGLTVFVGKHAEVMEEMGRTGEKVRVSLEKRGGEGKRTRDGALKVSTRFWMCVRC
jgi:kinesin family protein 11